MVNKIQFVCKECGHESAKWLGRCPNCNAWASFVEFSESKGPKSKNKVEAKKTSYLSEITEKRAQYTSTTIDELDNVLGGGLVSGQVVLIAGEPGIGKSTLLLALVNGMGASIYVSGEESVNQIKLRASRMGVAASAVAFLDETDIDVVIATLEAEAKRIDFKVIVIDSVQTMYTDDLGGVPGSVGQVKSVTFKLIEFSKRAGIPVVLVGHVTKDGTVAGPSTLAHMVDTVLWLEGDKLSPLRILRSIKNRFGATDEVGIFQMQNAGLISAKDAESIFLDLARKDVPGSALSCIMEGTRPILVEIQALVVPTKLAMPRRVVHGIDPKKLELIIAVLARYSGLKLYERDVFVNVAGGIKTREPGIDLAVAFAIASSYKDKPLPAKSIVVGELGLLGEIRESREEAKRIKRAAKQGITNSITAGKYRYIRDAILSCFKN